MRGLICASCKVGGYVEMNKAVHELWVFRVTALNSSCGWGYTRKAFIQDLELLDFDLEVLHRRA